MSARGRTLYVLEVRDETLRGIGRPERVSGRCSASSTSRDVEAVEQVAHFRHVVQRQHELAAQTPLSRSASFSKSAVVEVVAVELPSQVRRVEVEERRRTVKSLEDFFVRQAFDLHPFQSLMGFFNELREAFEIESRRLDHVPVIVGMSHEARKRILEEIEIPRRPLNVRERCRIGRLLRGQTICGSRARSGNTGSALRDAAGRRGRSSRSRRRDRSALRRRRAPYGKAPARRRRTPRRRSCASEISQ